MDTYIVIVIYFMWLSQLGVLTGTQVKKKNSVPGRSCYKTLAILNTIGGLGGMALWNAAFRKTGEIIGIHPTLFWFGVVGFIVMAILGCIYMLKALTCLN